METTDAIATLLLATDYYLNYMICHSLFIVWKGRRAN